MQKKLLSFILIIATLFLINNFNLELTGFLLYENNPFESGEINIHFCPKENCTKILIETITKHENIKCALYDLDNKELINLLKSKNAEIYLEEDNKLTEFNYGNSYALMHNKFCILDEQTIITGSTNPTNNGLVKNNNNLIIIKSRYLSKNYLEEFQEIKNNEFGKGKQVKYPKINLSGFEIRNYFCPEDNCKKQVMEELKLSKNNITFMTFSFTDQDISNQLIEKKKEGLIVQGIMESKRVTMQYNQYNYLTENNVQVYKDNNPYTMHHKVFIIDEQTVITGSYNPTKSGDERNDENIIIIKNKEIAKRYMQEFKSLI